MIPKINSAHGADTRNIINRAIEVLNRLGIDVQTLVAEGQLTEEQYAELITVINGLIKSGHVDKGDLSPEFKGEIEGFSAQLAQTLKQGEVSVSDIDKNKGKLDQTYLSDELLQQIAGSTPINAVPATNSIVTNQITRNAITLNEISFVDRSSNLFDKNDNGVVRNSRIDTSTGAVVESSTTSVSGKILVKPNETYITNPNTRIAFFDQYDKMLNNYINYEGNTVATSSANTSYVRLAISNDIFDNAQLNFGNSFLPYEPYYNKLNKLNLDGAKIENNSVGIDKVSFIEKSNNLFNKETVSDNYNIDGTTGELVFNTSYCTSDFVPVESNAEYIYKGFNAYAEYDSKQNFISRTNLLENTVFVTGAQTKFIRVHFNKEYFNLDSVWLNKGNTLLPYEPYGYRFASELNVGTSEVGSAGNNYLIDVPIDEVFNSNEVYGDYTHFGTTTAAEVDTLFNDLMLQYPNYITKKHLGNEATGKPIYAYHFTPERPTADETKFPKIFLTCGVHGYEHATTVATYLMFKQMCEKWKEDTLLEALRFNVDFIIIPVANPYGWDNYIRHNSNGVDINRNFPTKDWQLTDPTSNSYGGPEPLSEMESQYIKQIFDENPDIDIMYDLHNMQEVDAPQFLWIPSAIGADTVQVLSQKLISRLTRKWAREFSFLNEGDFVGYSNYNGGGGQIKHYAFENGIELTSTFEITYRWTADETSIPYNQDALKSGVEAIVNWLLMNLHWLIYK